MALQRVALNFPELGSEGRYLEHVPTVGDRLRSHGQDWVVEAVDRENGYAIVTLRAYEPG